MDIEQVRKGVRSGVFGVDELLQLLEKSLQLSEQLQKQLTAALKRIDELERQIGGPTQKLPEAFSMEAEERRRRAKEAKKERQRRNRKLRRGRMKTADKIATAARTERVLPKDFPEDQCWPSHTRVVWRLENGQAVLVAYEIWRGPGNRYGKISGVLGRSEFGIEILLAIAYQVHVVGLSFDKVCVLMNFFQNLKLRKSQVDALLTQLSRHWEAQFELLCVLVANSAVVHADETSWSIGSVWAVLGDKGRLVLHGVHKDDATLQQILDPATFQGLLISDDAAVYCKFNKAQKCWAHLLRKAIRLTLLEPDNAEYRLFLEELLAIYREACRVRRDRRLGDAGRASHVAKLDDRVTALCLPVWQLELPKLADGPMDDFRRLVNELMRLMVAQELFQFVTAPDITLPNGTPQPVSGTNNEAERTLRTSAQARDTGRTNKTNHGARRQTVLVSVLQSLKCYLPTFTMSTVIDEVQHWLENKRSCFERALRELKLHKPSHDQSILDRLLPQPSG